jgi:hypothetical protein
MFPSSFRLPRGFAKRSGRPLVVLATAWLGANAITASAAVAPAEQWLPAETAAYVTVSSASTARLEARRQAPLSLWSDPAFRPFRARFEAQLEARLLGPLSAVTGLPVGGLLALAEGQFTVALLPPTPRNASTDPLEPLLLLDAGAGAPELARLLAAARTPAAPAAAGTARPEITESRWREVPVVTFSVPGDRLDAVFEGAFPRHEPTRPEPRATPVLPFRIHTAQLGSVLVAGTQSNRVAEVLARLSTPAPASAPSAAGAPFAAESARFTNTLVHGWLDGPALLRHLTNHPPSLFAGLARAGIGLPRAVDALGLNQLRSASFTTRAGPGGWANEFHLAIPARARKGLFAFLQVLPLDAAPPPWVDAEVVSFRRVRLPGPGAWAALERFLRDLDPAFLGVLQLFTGYAGKTEDPNFDFQRGLIDRLGDDWMVLSARPANNRAAGEMLLHASPAAPALHGALRSVTAPGFLATFLPPDAPSPVREDQDLPGGRLTSLALTNAPWTETGAEQLHIGARTNLVLLSHGPALPAAFLTPAQLLPARSPLAALPALVDALPQVGGTGGGWFEYGSERQAVLDALRTITESDEPLRDVLRWAAISDTATRVLAGLGSWMDFALLPPAPQVARHFHIRVQGGQAGPEGLRLTTFRPRSPDPIPPPTPP